MFDELIKLDDDSMFINSRFYLLAELPGPINIFFYVLYSYAKTSLGKSLKFY